MSKGEYLQNILVLLFLTADPKNLPTPSLEVALKTPNLFELALKTYWYCYSEISIFLLAKFWYLIQPKLKFWYFEIINSDIWYWKFWEFDIRYWTPLPGAYTWKKESQNWARRGTFAAGLILSILRLWYSILDPPFQGPYHI